MSVQVNQDVDPERGMTFLEAKVGDGHTVRVYSDFLMRVTDDAGASIELHVAPFRESFEALMLEHDTRYGGRP